MKKELERRNQKLIFFNFKKSVRESIIGTDAKLSENFRGGLMENVFEGKVSIVYERKIDLMMQLLFAGSITRV